MAASPGLTSAKGARSRLRAHWRHLNGPGRIAGVDLARGLALIGMVAAHVTWIDEQVVWAEPPTWLGLVHGNSSILFATLAGVSVGIVTGGSRPVTGAERTVRQGRLLVRAAALWVIGVFLTATTVPVYVVLPAYAILFAIAAALVSLSMRALILTASAIAIVGPLIHAQGVAMTVWATPEGAAIAAMLGLNYPFVVWTAFVLAGLALARAGVTRLRVQLTTIVVGSALAAAGFALDASDGVRGPRLGSGDTTAPLHLERVWSAAPHSSGILEVIASGGLALAIIAACALLCRPWRRGDGRGTGWFGYATLPVRAVGAMPLTAYTAHLLAWFAVAAIALDAVPDLSGFRALEPFWPMTLGLIAGCTLWALLLGRGPLEAGIARLSRRLVPDPRPE